jgi:hypothetical protein
MAELVFRNLNKFQFLTRNKAQIDAYLQHVDGRLVARYGAGRMPVTAHDIWVITNCEAGIDASGKVDPRFRHSAGEVGFYPLPNNIAFWNGSDAPPFDQFTSLELNVYHYLLYLGHLKNRAVRTVDGVKLYSDLFRGRTGGATPARHAKIVAGIVHGYFVSSNYGDRSVPLQHLLAGYARDQGLAAMMSTTTYRHANTPVLTGRERNIADALRRMESGARATLEIAFPIGLEDSRAASAPRSRRKKKSARKRK